LNKEIKRKIELDLLSYKKIVDEAPIYFFKIDKDYRVIYVNNTFLNDFNYSEEDVIGKTAKDYGMDERVYKTWFMYYSKVFQSGQPDSFETNVSQSGNYYKVYLFPVIDENGEVDHLDMYLSNITNLKLVEDERDYIFNFSLDMFAIQTLEGDFIKVNPSWRDTLHYSNEKLLGSNWLEYVHSEDKERSESKQRDLENYNFVVAHEARFLNSSGDYVWLEWNSIPIKNKNIVVSVVRDITNWKEVNQKLFESEKRYRDIVESANYLLFSTDMEGYVLQMNKPGLRISKYTNDDLQGKNLLDLVHPKYLQLVRTYYQQLIAKKNKSNWIEFPIITKDNETIWLYQNSSIIYENFEPVRIDHISRDITARKKAEEKLTRSESMLRNVVNSSSEIILVIDKKGSLIDGNDTAFKFLDIENQNLLGKNLKELCSDEDSIIALERIIENLDDHNKARMISLLLHDNTEHILKVKSAEFADNDSGNILLFMTDLTEINKTKQITETLFKISREANLSRNLDTLYEKIHKSLKEIINATNFAVGYIDEVNKKINFPYFYDETDDDFESIDISDDISLTYQVIKNRKPMVLNEEQVRSHIGGYEEVYGAICKSWLGVPLMIGEEIYGVLMVQDYHIEDAYNDNDIQVLSSVSEILASTISKFKYQNQLENLNRNLEKIVTKRTEQLEKTLENLSYENEERKNTQDKLEKTQKELEQSLENEKELNLIKTRFIQMVSHEYRTPLTVILSASSLLQNYMDKMTEEQKDKQFNNITHSVSTMTNLLDDVLMIGKSELGKSLDILDFDLVNTVKSISENIMFIDNNKHKLVFDMPERLKIKSDKRLVDHIVNNLIMNAVKYSPKQKDVYVKVNEIDSNRFEFVVKDKGIGIPKEDLDNIFDSFYRSSNTGSIEGTGLGMSIVKKSIDSLQGTIQIESEESQGTKVSVILPINSEI
jgi:PAS domain S-box-containing protein